MKKIDKKIFGTLFFSMFGTVTGVGIVGKEDILRTLIPKSEA
jgi:hypothetical protein